MEDLYGAKQVAHFIVSYSNSLKNPISNLQLQKFLYFLWIEYYKKNKKYLFDDNFSARQFGPVIPDIYYEFCAYGGLPITETFNVSFRKSDETMIKDFVVRYYKESPFDLVKRTHKEGGAWDTVFNKNGKGSGNRLRIPFNLIIDRECS